MSSETSTTVIYDWVDADDQPVGIGPASEAHARGLFTRSVHVFVLNQSDEILLCRRASTKRHYASLFTSSAGGHVEQGESYADAARRELSEETGLDIAIEDIGRFDVINKTERAIHHLFLGKLSDKTTSIVTDPSEVESASFMTIQKIWSEVRQRPTLFAPTFLGALDRYISVRVKALLVIDFDHTIFDWYGYKSALQDRLRSVLDIQPESFARAKDEHEEADGLYNIFKHMTRISRLTGTPIEKLLTVLKELEVDMSMYIFSDAVSFLEKMRAEGLGAQLLTYGDPENQAYFIRSTGVSHYFDSIEYAETKQGKVEFLKKLTNDPISIVIVNDDPAETELMQTQIPVIRTAFLVERPTAKYGSIQPADNRKVVKSFHEITL